MSFTPKLEELVGRSEEIKVFDEFIADTNKNNGKKIIFFEGEGGCGKTVLVEAILKRCESIKVIACNLIDLSRTKYYKEVGILEAIANDLNIKLSARLSEQSNKLYAEFGKAKSRSGNNKASIRASFIRWYNSLGSDLKIIIAFDTFEQFKKSNLAIFKEVFIGIENDKSPQTFCVVAGRPLEKDAEILDQMFVYKVPLGNLPKEAMGEFLRANQVALSEKNFDKLFELTRGKPILLSLFIDWLRDGHDPDELLDFNYLHTFEESLVKRVLGLHDPEARDIIAMSFFPRRFNAKLLVSIFGGSQEAALGNIKRLSRFSFVKYRPGYDDDKREEDSCVLHDEMRRLLEKYVIEEFDLSDKHRKQWAAKAREYYSEEIEQSNERNRILNLNTEYLYYFLYDNLRDGFEYYLKLCEEAPEFDDDLKILTDSIHDFEKKLEGLQKLNVDLNRAIECFYESSYDDAYHRFAKIFSKIEEAEQRGSPFPVVFQAKTRSFSMRNRVESGRIQENQEDNALDQIEKFKEWLEVYKGISPDDKPQFEVYKLHAIANKGFIYRIIGKIEQAEEEYNSAIQQLEGVLEPSRSHLLRDQIQLLAQLKTNRAYCLHFLHRPQEAQVLCKSAIKFSEKIMDDEQLGLTYNTLGIISYGMGEDEQANSYFEVALDKFEETQYQRGKALVRIAQSLMLSQKKWYGRRSFKDLRTESSDDVTYKRALDYVDEAIKILEKSNEKNYLGQAYNDKGVLLRRINKLDDSIEVYHIGIRFAKEENIKYLEADILRNLGLTFWIKYQGDQKNKGLLNQAQEFCKKAHQIAKKEKAFQVLARVKRIQADIQYIEFKNYPKAFELAYEACCDILKRDNFTVHYTKSTKEIYYNDWLNWLHDILSDEKLPEAVFKEQSELLIDRWRRLNLVREPVDLKEVIFQKLVNGEYNGDIANDLAEFFRENMNREDRTSFIERIESIRRDREILKML